METVELKFKCLQIAFKAYGIPFNEHLPEQEFDLDTILAALRLADQIYRFITQD